MIDDIIDEMMTNLCYYLQIRKVSLDDIEIRVISTIEKLFDRRDELTEKDLAIIGQWVFECDDYFGDENFITRKIVTSIDPNRSGMQERDMREFIQSALRARKMALKKLVSNIES
jgi:hypothetical protein